MITTIAGRMGMTAETLRKWVRQAAVDEGESEGVSTVEEFYHAYLAELAGPA